MEAHVEPPPPHTCEVCEKHPDWLARVNRNLARTKFPTEYLPCELKGMVFKMRNASNLFYALATSVGNHAFIEFTGLMNEYIKVCDEAVDQGIDFTSCSTHTGVALPMKNHHIEYLFEKLNCIYGPSIAAAMKKEVQPAGADPAR